MIVPGNGCRTAALHHIFLFLVVAGTVTATAGSPHREHIARLHLDGRLGTDVHRAPFAHHSAVGGSTQEQIEAGFCGASSRHPVRAQCASLGQHRKGERLAEEKLPVDALTTAPPAPTTAGVVAKREPAQDDRVAQLQDFRVGDARVGHVRVHAARPSPARAGPTATRHRLVVAPALVADRDIVHAALRGRTGAESGEHGIDDALRRQYIPADDGRTVRRVEDGAGRHAHLDRRQAALVERHVVAHHTAQAVDQGRKGDGTRGVAVTGHFGSGAGEIAHRRAALRVDAHRQPDRRAVVHVLLGFEHRAAGAGQRVACDRLQHVAHGQLRVRLHMAHVGLHHRQAVRVDQLRHQLDALLVGGDLGAQIGQVVGEVARAGGARGGRGARQALDDRVLPEHAPVDEQERLERGPFLIERGGVGRHRAGRDATDVRVVSPGCHEEHRPGLITGGEHRRYDGQIGQMRSSGLRMVGQENVAGFERATAHPQLVLDRLLHGTEVHRDVRRVAHQPPVRAEQGAGEIEPLLDVGRDGRALQDAPHLLGDAHEPMVEDAQLHRIQPLVNRRYARLARVQFDHQIAAPGNESLRARFDHDRGQPVDDDGRSVDCRRHVRFIEQRRPPAPSHPNVLHQDAAALEHEAKLAPVAFAERAPKVPEAVHGVVRELHHPIGAAHERTVRALVAQVQVRLERDAAVGQRKPLALELLHAAGGQRLQALLQRGPIFRAQLQPARFLRLVHHVRQCHTVSGQDAGVLVDHDAPHAQLARDGTRMLPARPSKAREHVAGRVVAAGLRQRPDRSAHRLVGHAHESHRDLVERKRVPRQMLVDFFPQLLEGGPRRAVVETLVFLRSEDGREVLGQQPAEHEHAGPGCAPADSGPTTNRPLRKNNREPPPAATVLMSSCGAWMVTPAVVLSITCSYAPAYRDTSVDVPPMSNPISGGGGVGSTGSSVSSPQQPAASRTPVTAYPTTPPAGPLRMARAPRKFSMRHLGAAQLITEARPEPVQVALDVWREVRFGAGGEPARHHPTHRHRLVRQCHVPEAELTRNASHAHLVLRTGVTVRQDDGERTRTGRKHLAQLGPQVRLVQRDHLEVRCAGCPRQTSPAAGDAFSQLAEAILGRHEPCIDLDYLPVEALRWTTYQLKDAWPRLVADLQQIAKATVDDERDGVAGPLQQRIGGHRRPHPDPPDQPGVDEAVGCQRAARLLLQHAPDALGRCVRVVGRILREELQRADGTVRRDAQHVGEGATPVDGKVRRSSGKWAEYSEQFAQKIWPHERQWCLRRPSQNSVWQVVQRVTAWSGTHRTLLLPTPLLYCICCDELAPDEGALRSSTASHEQLDAFSFIESPICRKGRGKNNDTL
uniref:Secreted protein n=1 Tax=Anopheles atroparvus TaxID=41427 RepID=A0A182IL16_ANOAO